MRRQRAEQHRRVQVPHVADAEDAVGIDPGHARARCRASRPAVSAHQRRSRVPSPGAVRIVVTAWLRSAGSAMLSAKRAARAPGRRPPPRPRGRRRACRAPDRLQPLLVEDHVERAAQAVEVVGRRRAAEAAGSRPPARSAAPSPSRGSAQRTRAASARGPWKVKARPGGVISPFWQAATITSTPQASISKRSQARLAMQSTTRSAGCPAASSARAQGRDVVADRRGGVGLHRQHRADRVRRGRRAAARRRAPGRCRRGSRSRSPRPRRPSAAPSAAQPRPKRPVATTSARSPGREDVGDRRLPAGVAVADVDRDLARRCRATRFEVGDHASRSSRPARPRRCWAPARCMAREHPVGDDRRAGNGEDVAAAREGHGTAPDAMRARTLAAARRGGGNGEFRLGRPRRPRARSGAGRAPAPAPPGSPADARRPRPRRAPRPGGGSGATGWRRTGGCSRSRWR